MKRFKLGLNLAAEPPPLRFGDYLKTTELPTVPTAFGHSGLISSKNWGMLGNDQVGDCCIAGGMHAIMLWNAIANKIVAFSTADAIDDYCAACGYVRGDPATDNGGDINSVATYWQRTGLRDMNNTRHEIAAFMAADPTNLGHLDLACYLFDAVGLGVELPSSAEDQFIDGQPWSVVAGDTLEGGHFIPYVGKTADYRQVVTWGALQNVTEDWLKAYLKQVVVYVSAEYLVGGKSPLGFDMTALLDDMAEVAT